MAVDIRSPLFIVGALLCVMSFGMLLPALADWIDGGPDAAMFLACFAITAFAGGMLMAAFKPRERISITIHQAFVLTALTWVAVTLFAALPLAVSSLHLSYTDAFFEAMSGVTTTGSTVLVGLDSMPSGVLWWRSLLQWFGGVGIIVMAVSILPFLRIGGMQLFRTEFTERNEKSLPRMSQISAAILAFYISATALTSVALMLCGLSAFDAVNHAMTSISTAGFSTYDASVGALNNELVEYLLIVVMIVGGTPFLVMIGSWRNFTWQFARDSQVRVYVGLMAVSTVLLVLWRLPDAGVPVEQVLRESLFNVVSIATTTGYATADYTIWGSFPIVLVLFLMFNGGCTGSTSGGLKIFRLQILYQMARIQVVRLTHPHAVIVPRFNDREVTREVITSVAGYVFLYFFCFIAMSVGLSMFGLDLETSVSGAASAIGNIGPGVGDVIGLGGNYASLPDGAKWLLAVGMLLGRLEILTFVILLLPGFWRA
ncbi:MAG: TrkH family potassium uptake protein [Reyranellaceae bacterium]